MTGRLLPITVCLALALVSFGCQARRVDDRVSSGTQGPTSPVESGQFGPDAHHGGMSGGQPSTTAMASNDADLMYTNGKTDPTMEGSGNIAWQGTYGRERRANKQPEGQSAIPGQRDAGHSAAGDRITEARPQGALKPQQKSQRSATGESAPPAQP